MDTNDGGPAFPVVHAIIPQQGHFVTAPPAIHGMSLRDWFAGKALCGMMALQFAGLSEREFARAAWRQADAMLAERERKEGE